jgi:hypothetical protein
MDSKILKLIDDVSKDRILSELKKDFPHVDDTTLLNIYSKSVSIRQSNVQKNGSDLEKVVETLLEYSKIPFKRQVGISNLVNILENV